MKKIPVGLKLVERNVIAVDALAAKAKVSRAAMLEQLVVSALAREGVDPIEVREQVREGGKMALRLRQHLLVALRQALDDFEATDG